MRIADHLRSLRTFNGVSYHHHGIYLGRRKVIHYSGFASDGLASKATARICEASLSEFEADADSEVVRYAEAFPPSEVLLRARSCLGERDYNLVRNNCEHFAVWCKTGRFVSHQVDQKVAVVSSIPLPVVSASALAASIWADLKAIATVIDRHRAVRKALRAQERRVRDEEQQRLIQLRLDLGARVAELRRRVEAREQTAVVAARHIHERSDELIALLKKLADPGLPDALGVARTISRLLEGM